MSSYLHSKKLTLLHAKGGIMHFVIEKPARLYQGAILLSPVVDCHQRRLVHIKEFRYSSTGSTG